MDSIAHRAGGGFALVPERVANNQEEFSKSGKSFLAVPCYITGRRDGRKAFRAVLRGDLYGLGTTGVGDMVISNRRKA